MSSIGSHNGVEVIMLVWRRKRKWSGEVEVGRFDEQRSLVISAESHETRVC